MEAEKQLEISGPQGDHRLRHRQVQRCAAASRSCATRANGESYVTRQARWVDFENDYKTMDLSYMESVMWAFKQLWDKGLIYEGFKVMPYSWAAETPLSNFETRLDNSLPLAPGPGDLTVGFALDPKDGDPGPMRRARLDDDAVDAAVEPRARGR